MKIALLRRLEKEATIVPWLEQAAKVDAYNVGLHLLLARECGKAKQAARAEDIYRALADTSPSPELYRGLLRLYLDDGPAGIGKMLALVDRTLGRAGKKDEPDALAVGQARALIGALRENSDLTQPLATGAVKAMNKGLPLRFETLEVLAVFADKNRQLAEAEKFYRGCLKQLTPDAETMVYGGLIRVLGKARRFEAQLEVCDGALAGNPEQGLPKAQATSQVLFLTEKARALAGLQRYDDAVKAADGALALAGDNNKLLVRHLRVRLLSMAGRFDEAEKECAALLKQYPQPAEAMEIHYVLSNVYASAKQMAKSEEQLQLILKIDPDSAGQQRPRLPVGRPEQEPGRGGADDSQGDRRRSPPALGQCRAGATRRAGAARADRAGQRRRCGGQRRLCRQSRLGAVPPRPDRAGRKELERAARLPDGEDPVIWEHLGDVYQHLKMPADARRAWEHSVQLYDHGERRKDEARIEELQRKLKSVQAPDSR